MASRKIAIKPPMWAKYMFRIVFGLSTIITGWLALTGLIPESHKYEIATFINAIVVPSVYLLSKVFGITLEDK